MKPTVQPLARWRRTLIFLVLFLAFLVSLPAFMFYATGYRYDFFSDTPSITATGALYISAEAEESTIYIDEVEVTNARLFRKASYIQGLEAGVHRVHVQAPNLNTWVKNLSVYRHIVTEAEAFNLPLVPQVRPITMYQTVRGEALFLGTSSTTAVLPFASSSIPFVVSTSTATSTHRLNSEYILLNDLFAEKASTTAKLLLTEKTFGFSTTSDDGEEKDETATTTVTRNNLALYKYGEDVFAKALGIGRQIPHYFCVSQVQIEADLNSAAVIDSQTDIDLQNEELLFDEALTELSNNKRECRTEIRIDRKWQTVHYFDFLPTNENLVLMHLDEGIYVVEIDDRSWQNTQVLYAGRDLEMILYGGGIFVKDNNLILEVFTEIPVL